MSNYLFCFDIVGLSPTLLAKLQKMEHVSRLAPQSRTADMEPVFPCLTLPGQASFFTGTWPAEHGIIANGFYDRDRFEVSFWDQYRTLVQARPVWERLKEKNSNCKTALLFCQNTLYGHADMIVTPKPMHTDEGLVQWCYSKPVGLYEQLCRDLGQPFNLMDYWGPFASHKSSEWIMAAAQNVAVNHKPNFMAVYIPHLDYSCQKYGPEDPRVDEDLAVIDRLIGGFMESLEKAGILEQSTLCLFSEYSLFPVTGAVQPNNILRRNGFLSVRTINGKEYLDFEMSRAFAMVDHQAAHIFINDRTALDPVKKLLETTDGVAQVLDNDGKKAHHVDHPRSGDLVAVSDPDKWFAYYWWETKEAAPDFAEHIDIHRKPGYDPVELFMNKETFKIPLEPGLIKGSHGAPPSGGYGMAAIMLWGKGVRQIALPQVVKTVDVSDILEKLLETAHV
ncbi:alkaline phosphatase family protein [Desulfobacter postgatei]|uniref:alkaline phosphatase family protein n=1 Tax=Desulfobacter postgatei TaxID=2293 RepID=UPI00259B41B6|nr:alkaline phosphatase family protein [uncultured Desulfobacter sp.]